VKPAPFAYHRAHSVGETVALLAELGDEAKILAGGLSLVPMMNFRLARPSALIDVTKIVGLSYLRADGDGLRIGALTTHRTVETSRDPAVTGNFGVLPRSARWIGHYPIRSRGTFGGSIAHADPASEWCLLAILLGARVVLTGPGGRRDVPAAEFFQGYYTTVANPDEMITELWFPRPEPHAVLTEFAPRQGDFAVVAAALGVRELPGTSPGEAVARVLARQQLLLVLDNCEHVIGAAAQLCAGLLEACDDVRVLATSREPLRIAGEVRYRLGPLTLPDPGDLAAAARCEAVTLFADRARRVEPGFALNETTTATVERLVARLDGMPLAIELAAARVEALGVAQLLDRIDDRFGLLADGDRLAEERQRSLAGAVRWSYQLLDDTERRVFRAVSVFPGPFTLDAAQAVAGTQAGQAVLRLVDCSLVQPPQTGPDDRARYGMLETLRAYGAGLLAEADEEDQVSAALAEYAAEMAGNALVDVYTRSRELDGLRYLDAEDVTMRHVLAWALEHDPGTAVRLALNLAPWWGLRGRLASQAPLLTAVAELADAGGIEWCAAHMFLAQVAGQIEDPPAALDHLTAARDALQDASHLGDAGGPWLLSLCLGGRSSALIRLGRVAEAIEDGRRALDLAREVGIGGLEATALASLSLAVWYGGDRDGGLRLARQALAIMSGIYWDLGEAGVPV